MHACEAVRRSPYIQAHAQGSPSQAWPARPLGQAGQSTCVQAPASRRREHIRVSAVASWSAACIRGTSSTAHASEHIHSSASGSICRRPCAGAHTAEHMLRRACIRPLASERIHRDRHHTHDLLVHQGRQGSRLGCRLLPTQHVRTVWISAAASSSAACIGAATSGPMQRGAYTPVVITFATCSSSEAGGLGAGSCQPSM